MVLKTWLKLCSFNSWNQFCEFVFVLDSLAIVVDTNRHNGWTIVSASPFLCVSSMKNLCSTLPFFFSMSNCGLVRVLFCARCSDPGASRGRSLSPSHQRDRQQWTERPGPMPHVQRSSVSLRLDLAVLCSFLDNPGRRASLQGSQTSCPPAPPPQH